MSSPRKCDVAAVLAARLRARLAPATAGHMCPICRRWYAAARDHAVRYHGMATPAPISIARTVRPLGRANVPIPLPCHADTHDKGRAPPA
jgi:hypothetical protein